METDNFWEIKKKLTFTEICVEVRRLGDDYHILVSGGECPHIGCTVLAIPRPSLDGSGKMSSTASVLNVTGHKDEKYAVILLRKYRQERKRPWCAPEVFTWTGSRKNRLRKLWKPCG